MDQFMIYVGYVTAILCCFFTVIKFIQWIVSAKNKIQEPNKLQDGRILAVETRCDKMQKHLNEIDDHLSRDSKRLNDHEKFMELSIKAQLALVNHALSGNNIDELESVKDEFCEKTSVVFTNKESREREEEKK